MLIFKHALRMQIVLFLILLIHLLLILLNIKYQLGYLERNATKPNDIIQADLMLPLRQVLHHQPQVVVDNIIFLLILILWFKQVVLALVINHIHQLALGARARLFFLELARLDEQDVVRSVLLDYVAADQLSVCVTVFVVLTVAFVEVE